MNTDYLKSLPFYNHNAIIENLTSGLQHISSAQDLPTIHQIARELAAEGQAFLANIANAQVSFNADIQRQNIGLPALSLSEIAAIQNQNACGLANAARPVATENPWRAAKPLSRWQRLKRWLRSLF